MSGKDSYLWHYTSAEGIRGIMERGMICAGNKANPLHARYGNRVYWSRQPPHAGRLGILFNNYGIYDATYRPTLYAKTEYYVRVKEVDLPNLQHVDDDRGRSVYVSDDVDLRDGKIPLDFGRVTKD